MTEIVTEKPKCPRYGRHPSTVQERTELHCGFCGVYDDCRVETRRLLMGENKK